MAANPISAMNASIRANALAEHAHDRLLGVLMERNTVSPGHFRATRQMLAGMAAQAVGVEPGPMHMVFHVAVEKHRE